ncbi:MAG TPA: hypothetical protein V6D29_03975 [Leptolyngbyaceae cyanobacterium]
MKTGDIFSCNWGGPYQVVAVERESAFFVELEKLWLSKRKIGKNRWLSVPLDTEVKLHRPEDFPRPNVLRRERVAVTEPTMGLQLDIFGVPWDGGQQTLHVLNPNETGLVMKSLPQPDQCALMNGYLMVYIEPRKAPFWVHQSAVKKI